MRAARALRSWPPAASGWGSPGRACCAFRRCRCPTQNAADGRDALAHAGGAAVRRAGDRRSARICADRRERRDRRSDLPAARRNSDGDRAGRCRASRCCRRSSSCRGLDHRFRLLTGGSRTALPRHQTLHALIDWSYGLLSDEEKSLLRRLSVFSGGTSLASITAVVAGAGAAPTSTSSSCWRRWSTNRWWSPISAATRRATACWKRPAIMRSRSSKRRASWTCAPACPHFVARLAEATRRGRQPPTRALARALCSRRRQSARRSRLGVRS